MVKVMASALAIICRPPLRPRVRLDRLGDGVHLALAEGPLQQEEALLVVLRGLRRRQALIGPGAGAPLEAVVAGMKLGHDVRLRPCLTRPDTTASTARPRGYRRQMMKLGPPARPK